ncbi:MAG: urease accessory protein UreF [Leptolyngbyaceae cyanobacterium bins.59]|nr:urease accessory protein UreF [Leptolyngbyaceae cyanobacterium bins.59]
MLALLRLLQLTSPALPVGAFSYSEGLETLVDQGIVIDRPTLEHWLHQELRSGAVRIEVAVMVRAHRSAQIQDVATLTFWNNWLSATRETVELRQQSWQMGQSLIRLLQATQVPEEKSQTSVETLIPKCSDPWNFAIAFGLAAVHWQIDSETALQGYLYSWAANLVSAGVRLIPLGQTVGQQLLLDLQPVLIHSATSIASLQDDELQGCTWGLALASMNHEVQYSRLFRS